MYVHTSCELLPGINSCFFPACYVLLVYRSHEDFSIRFFSFLSAFLKLLFPVTVVSIECLRRFSDVNFPISRSCVPPWIHCSFYWASLTEKHPAPFESLRRRL